MTPFASSIPPMMAPVTLDIHQGSREGEEANRRGAFPEGRRRHRAEAVRGRCATRPAMNNARANASSLALATLMPPPPRRPARFVRPQATGAGRGPSKIRDNNGEGDDDHRAEIFDAGHGAFPIAEEECYLIPAEPDTEEAVEAPTPIRPPGQCRVLERPLSTVAATAKVTMARFTPRDRATQAAQRSADRRRRDRRPEGPIGTARPACVAASTPWNRRFRAKAV